MYLDIHAIREEGSMLIQVTTQNGRDGAGEIRKINELEMTIFDLLSIMAKNGAPQEKIFGAVKALLAQRAEIQEYLIWGSAPIGR